MSTLGQPAPKINPPSPNRPTTFKPGPLGFAFVAVPHDLRGLGLNSDQKLLFGVVLGMTRTAGGVCKAFNATLASLVECSAREIKRDLDALEAAGLIRREYEGGDVRRTRRIFVVWTPPESQVEPRTLKIEGGPAPAYPTDEQYQGGPAPAYPVGQSRPTPGTDSAYPVGQPRPTFKNSSEQEKEFPRTAPPPASARNEPAASPQSGEGDGTGLPPGFNVTGLGPDGIRRAIESGVSQAVQRASDAQGEAAEGGGVFPPSRTRRALRDAREASRGPVRKLTPDELRAQVEGLRARHGKDGPRGSA